MTLWLLAAVAASSAGCATCFYYTFAPLSGQADEGEVVEYKVKNFSYRYPGSPWYDLADNRRNDESTLELISVSPGIHFMVIAEPGDDATMTSARLADISAGHVTRLEDGEPEVGERKTVTWGGVTGYQFDAGLTLKDERYRLVKWAGASNGFYYQMIVSSSDADLEELHEAADELFAGFTRLDDTRLSPNINVKRFQKIDSERYGYELELDPDRFVTWVDRENFPRLELTGSHMKGSPVSFGVVALHYDAGRPRVEALQQVAASLLGWSSPDPDQKLIPSPDGKLPHTLMMHKDIDGTPWDYLFLIFDLGDRALFFLAWGSTGAEPVKTTAKALLKGLKLKSPVPWKMTGLDEERRVRHARLHNEIGLYYDKASQYQVSLRWFEVAARWGPGERPFVMNLMGTYNRLGQHTEALLALGALPKSTRDDATIAAWEAWHLRGAGRLEESLAVYERLFATGHSEEEDLRGWLEVLEQVKGPAAADAAWTSFAARHGDLGLKTRHAERLIKREAFDRAIVVVRDAQASIPFSPELAYLEIEALYGLERYQEVLALCERLVDSGFESVTAWRWRGRAQAGLRWHKKAKASFEKVLEVAPDDKDAREWVEWLSSLLGEGDNSDLKRALSPLPPPPALNAQMDKLPDHLPPAESDSGATYAYRVQGFGLVGKTAKRTWYQRIHIHDPRGVTGFSTLTFGYNPTSERIFVNQLAVRDAKGHVVATPDVSTYYVIDDRSSGMATEDKVLHLPIPRLEPGHTIDVVVTIERKSESGRLGYHASTLAARRPTTLASVFVSAPEGSFVASSSGAAEPLAGASGKAWVVRDVMPYINEPLSPPFEEVAPMVFIGDAFKGKAEGKWQQLAADYQKDIADKLAVDEDTRALAKRLTADAKTRTAKIDALWRHVQERVNYQALEFGVRGVIPHPAARTLKDGYGDCKDHAVLLRALLAAADIPSELMLIHTYRDLQESLPSLDQFNHMVLFVPEGRKGGRVIDATDKEFNRTLRTPTSIAGRTGLVLGERPRLVKVPTYGKDASSLDVDRVVAIGNGGVLEVEERLVFTGVIANYERATLKRRDAAEQKEWATRILRLTRPRADVKDVEIRRLFDNDRDLELTVRYVLPRREGADLRLPVAWERYYIESSPAPDRRAPYRINVPFSFHSQTEVTGAPLKVELGKPHKSSAPGAACTAAVKAKKAKQATLDLRCELTPGTYPADRYQGYLDALRLAGDAVEHGVAIAPSDS